MANNPLYQADSINKFTSSGNYIAARDYLLSVQDQLSNYSDSIQVSYLIALGEISIIAHHEGEGFKCLQEALALAEKSQNNYLINKAKIQLIEFYRKIREYENAMDIIKPMLKDLPNDMELKCRLYHRISAVYNELYDAKNGTVPEYLDTALLYSQKSLAISKKNKLYSHQYTSYRELSAIYNTTSFLHSMNKSKLYMDSALMTIKNKNELDYYFLLKAKAHLFLNNKEFDSSIYFARKAIPFMENSKNHQLQMEIYWVLSHAYFALNDSLMGLKYMVKEAQSDVKYRKSYTKSQLVELTTVYQVEAKDKLIAQNREELLEVDKEKSFYFYSGVMLLIIILFIIFYSYKTKKQNKVLAKLVKENEFLVGESNHRIKNNLQLIVSLIERELYKDEIENSKLTEISEKIKSIAILHQQLYMKQSKEEVSVKSYLEEIKINLQTNLTNKDVKIDLLVEDFALEIDKSVFLGLLITELITNSLKHAFVKNKIKEIHIQAFKKGEFVQFQYADSGCGIAKGEKPTLALILIKQLKGEYSINSENGLKIKLKFKP